MHVAGTTPARSTPRAYPPPSNDRYARVALERECAEVARTASGRNARLNAAAYALGQFVGACLLGEDEVERALLEAAEACGYVSKDGLPSARATIQSGLRRGMLEPRDVPPHSRGDGTAPRGRPVDLAEVARQEHIREQARQSQEADARAKAELVARLWDEADPDPGGTLVDLYLWEKRRIPRDLLTTFYGHTIRFHSTCPMGSERVPVMLSALRDIHTDAVVGLHRTQLDPVTAEKVGRKMLGRAAGAAIKLSCDAEVTMGLTLAEGLESAASAIALGLGPAWALGSVGGIAKFPLLSGVACLTVCAEAGPASEAAVQEVGTRWTEGGREVRVSYSRHGSDLNDALKALAR